MVTNQYSWLLQVEEFWSMSQHGGPHHYGAEDANFRTRPEVHRSVGDPVHLEQEEQKAAYWIRVEIVEGRHVVTYHSPE